jgi:K+-sensing histidine kinase KdpD
VTDTGPGISEEEREAVLRRFYHSDKMHNTPGVGLGLNLVAAIVKLHDLQACHSSGPRRPAGDYLSRFLIGGVLPED